MIYFTEFDDLFYWIWWFDLINGINDKDYEFYVNFM
jgi:hypothetical protein